MWIMGRSFSQLVSQPVSIWHSMSLDACSARSGPTRRPVIFSMITGHANASRLTRRAFLRAGVVAAGLGSAALAGCDEPPVVSTRPASTPGLPALVLPAGLGVNLHLTSTTHAQIAQLARVGFRFARLDLLWDQVERRRGYYDFSTYEPIVDTLLAHGVRPLFLLGYDNALYEHASSPPSTVAGLHTDEARQSFARFAAAAAVNFRGRGIIWEIWNEPDNVHFWEPAASPAEYMTLAKLVVPT